MSDAPLLLPSAKSGILITGREAQIRLAAMCVGAFVIFVGAADLASRAIKTLGPDSAQRAFAPAIAAVDPSVLASATTTGAIVPAKLSIPSLGVNAPVEQVSVKADGTMGTPTKFGDVAWYAPGSKPGSQGNSVFAGHVNNALTTSGIFEHLDRVKKGDYVTVSDEAGRTLVYRVFSTSTQPMSDEPAAAIFSTSGPHKLILITCAGDWIQSERQFSQRLIVVAVPAY